MTKCFLNIFFILILFFSSTILSGQKSVPLIRPLKTDSARNSLSASAMHPVMGSIEEYIELQNELPSEKIFLHLDRFNYSQGDTIWFKAYSWYGYDQIPDTISGILYVDLINAEGRVALRRKLLIQNGNSHGDFSLDSAITPGLYSLRAYTRLMLDIKTVPFYQTINISPVKEKFYFECTPVILKQKLNDSLKIGFRFFEPDAAGIFNNSLKHKISYSFKIGNLLVQKDSMLAENTKEQVLKYSLKSKSKHDSVAVISFYIMDDQLSIEKQFTIPLEENIDLQFFPEGGNLVAGLESKVAFKAIGIDGLSRKVSGEILVDDDKIVTGFKSMQKGMGYFMLKPQSKKQYSASFWYNNQKYIVPLPQVFEKGTVMSLNLRGHNKEPILSIKQTQSESIINKYVIGSSYGKVWFSALMKAFKDSCELKIPLELLPEGVCRLTLLNENFEPECERLIYVDKNRRFKIEVISDSSSYKTRSRVTLFIKTTNFIGAPVQTDLSLAVIDKEQKIKDPNIHGISAYKLIGSELHGYVEDADSYFKNDSCINKDDLDLLLLTQGYRRFLLKTSNTEEQKFKPEKSLAISGYIKLNSKKSRDRNFDYRDIDLVLISGFKNSYLGLSKPDSIGNFKFQVPLLFGKSHSMLQATTNRKKPFDGNIFLYDQSNRPQFTTMPQLSNNLVSPSVEYLSQIQTVSKTERSKINLPGTMSKTLGEVVISAKVKPKNWWRNYDKDALKIANLDTIDPNGNRYRSLNDLLVEEFGAQRYSKGDFQSILLPCVRTASHGGSYWFPIYVIDGKKYWNGENFDFTPLNTLSSFHVDAIKRILVVPPGKSIGMYYAYGPIIGFPHFILQSVVIIETYSNNTYRGDPQGIKTFILDGLDAPSVFYSPRYEGFLKNSPVYDGRATIFWAPSILTDENGKAKVEFFTSDRQTTLQVIANGIEVENGNPGEVNKQISVNLKKQNH